MPTTIRPRRPGRDERAALRRLIDADRLPGQPALTGPALDEAVAGRSAIDRAWWDELDVVHVDVLDADAGGLSGAVSWAVRPRDDTAVLLWLHAREDPATAAALLDHVLARHPGPWEAFDFASALTLGVEALPVAHRPVTAEALTDRGFRGRDLWRYMHRPLVDLPARPAIECAVGPARLDGVVLTTPDGAGSVELTGAVGGTVLLGWLGVDPAARGRGLGAALLHAALHHLADRHATDVVLVVDDDAPGTDRDRRAACRLYDRAGFREVDRLHSYRRAPEHS